MKVASIDPPPQKKNKKQRKSCQIVNFLLWSLYTFKPLRTINKSLCCLYICKWAFSSPSVSKIIFINWKSWCAILILKEKSIPPFIVSYNDTVLESGGVRAVCALVKTIKTVTIYTCTCIAAIM